MSSEIAKALLRSLERFTETADSAATGVSRWFRAVADKGLRQPAHHIDSADVDAASPVEFAPGELRAPTIQERWLAFEEIYEARLPDPVMFHSAELDSIAQVKLHIALENLYPDTLSIKERAARIVIRDLPDLPSGKPILLASSGNHAIAYAEACRRRAIPLTAVVPANTPALKVAKLEERGATVIRYGSSYDDAYAHARQLTQDHGGIFMDVSAHDSVAALGTVVTDMLSQRPFADVVVLPAGGGTVASAASVIRDLEQHWGRRYKVLIACPENAPTVYESFKSGTPVTVLPHSIAEAVNVGTVDAHLLPEIIRSADDVVLVPEAWIQQGTRLLSDAIGHPVEAAATLGPMAVLGSQGVLHGASGVTHDIRGLEILTVVTGGNIDLGTLTPGP
ncbi:pyridoxal-phosphate dependent enzyme [Nocardia carnea]|uniref:pyridoxal-phosphate dependent enzyme n=1 Tax=Nocardia carnea TaxID=37328 RepID=UPI0024568062|nr:pyridoxal-phosphate dependent enzyme [Nocardia carnea]